MSSAVQFRASSPGEKSASWRVTPTIVATFA